jgi:hypothetical protein
MMSKTKINNAAVHLAMTIAVKKDFYVAVEGTLRLCCWWATVIGDGAVVRWGGKS